MKTAELGGQWGNIGKLAEVFILRILFSKVTIFFKWKKEGGVLIWRFFSIR
jgi:hypothetical protein